MRSLVLSCQIYDKQTTRSTRRVEHMSTNRDRELMCNFLASAAGKMTPRRQQNRASGWRTNLTQTCYASEYESVWSVWENLFFNSRLHSSAIKMESVIIPLTFSTILRASTEAQARNCKRMWRETAARFPRTISQTRLQHEDEKGRERD